MKQLLSNHWKRYAVSSLVSFVSGFAIAVLPLLDNLSLADVRGGAFVGLGFVGLRAGLKALLEAFVAWRASK